MGKKQRPIRSRVLLAAFDKDGAPVEEADISCDEYYGGISDLVDSDEYRAQKGIRSMKGRIFGYKGNLQQEFDAYYDQHGKYVRSRAVHEDGTVIED